MTMEVIQHIELGSAQASISFSSIPATFTDLCLVLSLRATASGTNVGAIQFNGSTSNFSLRLLQGDGSSTSSANYSANYAGIFGGSTMTANTFGNASIYIPNYANATAAKSFSVDAVTENNATLAYQNIQAGLWNNTAAINAISISFLSGGDWAAGSSATLYGIKRFNTTLSPKATGGAISYDSVNNKWVHAFYTSGTFTPTENLTGVEYLVIAGGGGGATSAGAAGGGGGGAGGYRSSVIGESSGGGASAESTLSVDSGVAQTVTVGAGGAGGNTGSSGNEQGYNGSNSVFGSITATGGGGGGRFDGNGSAGGSGGGGGASYINGSTVRTGGSGTTNQGYAGGNGFDYYITTRAAGGSGGGAGGSGGNASSGVSGSGGSGLTSSITGTAIARAGGGSGAAMDTIGSVSAGGGAGTKNAMAPATSGSINTGGGGGGGIYGTFLGNNSPGGAGGSGVVIIRYSA